jgi:hypothetical protein
MKPTRDVLLLGLLLLASAFPARTQESSGIGYVAPKIPQDPNLSKVAFFRLCYPGSANAPSISLAQEPKGSKPTIIETNLPADTYSDYVPMKPGRFTLHLLDGNIPNDPAAAVPVKEKKLAEPLKAEMSPGSYSTLFVIERGGKITASFLPDPAPAGSAPHLRVIDASGLGEWSVRLLTRENQPIKTLWNSGEAASGISLPSKGVYYIEVLRTPAGEDSRQLGIFETQLNSGTPFSIILSAGPGGEGAAHLVFDCAPGNYDRDAVKALAGGTSP